MQQEKEDIIETLDNMVAQRIGQRLKTLREKQGISRKNLGEAVGLNADRIAKYEYGSRKPKLAMLQRMAEVLGVNINALIDPVTMGGDYEGLMFALFEIEENYGLELTKQGDAVLIEISDKGISQELLVWVEKQQEKRAKLQEAISQEEIEDIEKEYYLWKKKYPEFWETEFLKTARKNEIERKIKALKDELSNLE